ncbi:MAG: FAD-binding oxidoreductase [Rhodospirillales bacterium]|nr:FAD-binding oxidoreductase [Rhodospirillales bacterium]
MPGIPLQPVAGDETLPGSVDVVIIGGGIVGASAALFLAKAGIQVSLCEKGAIGAEQSGRNWGWVRQMGREPVEIPLAVESLKLWRGLNRVTTAETGFRETGITYLCERTRDADDLDVWHSLTRDSGLSSRWLSEEELASLLPGLAKPIKGALYTATDGRAEPELAAPAIAEAARRAGSHVITNCAVRGIERQAGRVCGIVTERGVIACRAVVAAGGAWTRLFLGNLGVDFPQLKILGLAARIDNVKGVADMPVGGRDFSFRRRLDGGFTIGLRNHNIAPLVPDSFRLFADFLPNLFKHRSQMKLRVGRRFVEEWRTPRRWRLDEISPFERERVSDPRPVERLTAKARVNLAKAFPAFADARITQSWAGLIDVTPDGTPVIGPVDDVPGLYIASGFSGHGFGIGPGAGRLVADLVLGLDPCVDPDPFRLGRFRTRARQQA